MQKEQGMPRTSERKPAKVATAARKARTTMTREARAAYGEVDQGVKHLTKSIAEIQHGVRRAERKIEADARARVREIRREARAQLSLLEAKRREGMQFLKKLSAAGAVLRERIVPDGGGKEFEYRVATATP